MSATIATTQANYLNHPKGWKSWVFTLDHKRIGILYFAAVMTMFLLGGIFALLVRIEHLSGAQTIMSAATYNKVFSMHGIVMVFLFIIPSVPAALGNFILPLMLGAKDVAFPRLNLCSWYLYVGGALFAIYGVLHGGVDTGWTFYTPYSTGSATKVVPVALAAFILGFSSIFTGLNFIVTIHKLRAPGISWFRLPLMVWALYATAVIQVLATPVIGITLVLLIMERVMGIGIFDPAMGGDPVLFQHFFWFYSHPAVYIMILPGMGIISELISTFSHKRIFGFKAIAYSSIAIALISFLVWGHHMFVAGQSKLSSLIFSFLTFFVAVPSAIKVFNWMSTLYKGQIKVCTPFLYALWFLILFTIGGLTGIFLGTLGVDVHLTDTYFIVAHFHYVMVGGTVIAFLGGIHYWWPKMFGRMYDEFWGMIASTLVFIGFNVTFIPQFIMGSQGMPRRYYNYLPQYHSMHLLSTIGSWIMALGLVITAIYLIRSLFVGAPAGKNPWASLSYEWLTNSPPPTFNFDETPVITHGPYDYDEVAVEVS
jgi:cytochrome c oxidase subunit 1